MDAHFHNDPRIREWINQIVEKIFTVCLLTGVDSDAEFQKGCQIVIKLTSLLQEIPTLPSEFLADGVKQLLEQRLPDARVINSFPAFQATMDRMLREGLLKVTDTQKKEAFNGLASYTESTKEISLEPHDSYTERPKEVSHLEFVTHSVIPALTTVNIPYPDIQQTKAAALSLADALAQADAQAKADALALTDALAKVDALSQAETLAKADALTFAEALAQAETQAKADALALADALAKVDALTQAETLAKADALALADALARADAQAKADALSLAEVLAQVDALTQAEKQAKVDALVLAEALTQAETQAKADALALADALAQADAQAKADALSLTDALAKVDALTQAEKQAKADALTFAEALAQADAKFEAVTVLEPDALIKVPALVTSVHSKPSQVFRPSQDPKQANVLKRVLSNIFPKGTVYWNKSLMGQTFLAQVEDILICVHDPEHPCNLKKYNKDGWKVLVCSTEDLTFPRRLERGIRQIQRSVLGGTCRSAKVPGTLRGTTINDSSQACSAEYWVL